MVVTAGSQRQITFMGVDSTTDKQTTPLHTMFLKALSMPTLVEISRLRGLTARKAPCCLNTHTRLDTMPVPCLPCVYSGKSTPALGRCLKRGLQRTPFHLRRRTTSTREKNRTRRCSGKPPLLDDSHPRLNATFFRNEPDLVYGITVRSSSKHGPAARERRLMWQLFQCDFAPSRARSLGVLHD